MYYTRFQSGKSCVKRKKKRQLINYSKQVTIKNGVVFSPNVSILCAIYPMDPRRRKDAKGNEIAKPVVIREDCWLGGNVIVM